MRSLWSQTGDQSATLPPVPETEQGARKDILTELVLPMYVTQPGYGEEEHGEAGLSKAISVSW